jgi:hypothetical protein
MDTTVYWWRTQEQINEGPRLDCPTVPRVRIRRAHNVDSNRLDLGTKISMDNERPLACGANPTAFR